MPAFDFPNPPTPNQEVTNDATGVTYRYDAATQSWMIVTTQGASNLASDVAQLQLDVNTLETLLPLETSARQQGDANLQTQINNIDTPDPFDPTPIYAALETESRTRELADTDLQQQINNIDIPDVDLSSYYNKTEVDAKDQALQIQIDDLKITKGAAAVYTLNDIGIVVGIRPGDFYIDNTVAKSVEFMTFAPTDNNGNDRPLGAEGDIVELVGLNNKHYRYEILTAGEGVAGVAFITAEDPDDLLIPGTTFQVYIYPQNSASASTEYVDAGLDTKLSLTGGDLSGNLNTNSLIKSTRTSGYSFQVYDEANDSNPAFIHSNGNGRFASGVFTQSVEIRGGTTLKGDLHLEGNLSFTTGGTIHATSNNPVLSGRASLDIRAAADYPVVISSGSGYKKVLAIYGFDGDQDDNRGEKAYINGDGKAYFSEVYANDEELATKTYVDSKNATPNGRKFGFYNGTGAVTGKLNYFESGGVVKLRLSNTDAFGIKWNDGGITQDITMTNGPYFTIWEVVDDTNHKIIRQGRISRIDYHESDILCYTSSHRTNGGFSTSKNYWVTIGGII